MMPISTMVKIGDPLGQEEMFINLDNIGLDGEVEPGARVIGY